MMIMDIGTTHAGTTACTSTMDQCIVASDYKACFTAVHHTIQIHTAACTMDNPMSFTTMLAKEPFHLAEVRDLG